MPLSAEQAERLSHLEGLVSDAVGTTLAELAAGVRAEHAIVEIGSYRGKSTCYLAAGSLAGAGAPVFAVDPWDLPGNIGGRFHFDAPTTRQAFHAQVGRMGLGQIITPLRAFSWSLAAAWQRPIGLLYIDGSHTEKDVRTDWRCWHPHLAPGAVVAFDDYRTPRNPGVAAVVDELVRSLAGARWTFEPQPLAICRLA